MLGIAKPIPGEPSLLISLYKPKTRIKVVLVPLFYPDVAVLPVFSRTLRIPMILTRLPGVTLSHSSRSAVNKNVLGISPVGTSSGAS